MKIINNITISLLLALVATCSAFAMEQNYTQNYQQPTLQYKHHSYLSDGQRLGWLYIPQVNDWALINLGFNNYPYVNPQTGQANFFYANPDVPTAKNPHGLYFWASQYPHPIIGNNNLRTAVKHAPGNQHTDVIYNDQNQQYGFMWYGNYYRWDASIHVEHGYFIQSSQSSWNTQAVNTQPTSTLSTPTLRNTLATTPSMPTRSTTAPSLPETKPQVQIQPARSNEDDAMQLIIEVAREQNISLQEAAAFLGIQATFVPQQPTTQTHTASNQAAVSTPSRPRRIAKRTNRKTDMQIAAELSRQVLEEADETPVRTTTTTQSTGLEESFNTLQAIGSSDTIVATAVEQGNLELVKYCVENKKCDSYQQLIAALNVRHANGEIKNFIKQSLINKQKQGDNAQCPICYDDLSLESAHISPVCGHTACNNCTQELQNRTHRVTCPICRKEGFEQNTNNRSQQSTSGYRYSSNGTLTHIRMDNNPQNTQQ